MLERKKIIIIAPHFPPSNLAGVHRSRLFAQHLPNFGWEPIIVTVDEKYYEEETDPYIEKLLPDDLRIEKVKALPVKPIKIIGEIGIRAFFPLLFRILKLAKQENINFLYIPIPSNFAALLGPLVHKLTGINYGIDYIDPWVHTWPGSEKRFTKAWLSRKMGEILEPLAVKKASLITGVAPGYFEAVLERNPHLKQNALTTAMPYGGEKKDHEIIHSLNIKPYLFEKESGILNFVYAGAMLPKAFKPLEEVMKAIVAHPVALKNCRIHFIGSGTSPNDPQGYNIRDLAMKYGLWEKIFFEYPKRISYMEVITHLNAADGTFILGSTEPHYTPSKVYQSVLSGKATFAILHHQSSACEVIKKSKCGTVLEFDGELDLKKIAQSFHSEWKKHLIFLETFAQTSIDQQEFEKYSARSVTAQLANALEKVITKCSK